MWEGIAQFKWSYTAKCLGLHIGPDAPVVGWDEALAKYGQRA